MAAEVEIINKHTRTAMAAVVDVLVAEQLSEMAGLWLLIAAGIVYTIHDLYRWREIMVQSSGRMND
jgi:hypothetical protein